MFLLLIYIDLRYSLLILYNFKEQIRSCITLILFILLYYLSDFRLSNTLQRLSPEAIEEIKNAQNNIPDAQRIMCKKHRIGSTTYQKIIDNQRPPEPTEEWRRIIESVSISDQISENNQESSHDTPFSHQENF